MRKRHDVFFRGQPHGACRPLIACERGSAGSIGSTGSGGKGAAQKIMKRRGVLIALRAVVISSVALDPPCRTVSMLTALLQSPIASHPSSLIPSPLMASHPEKGSIKKKSRGSGGSRVFFLCEIVGEARYHFPSISFLACSFSFHFHTRKGPTMTPKSACRISYGSLIHA